MRRSGNRFPVDAMPAISSKGPMYFMVFTGSFTADDRGQDFTFPPGTVLQPGQRIRVYTNQVHPQWGGFTYGSGRPIWNDKGDNAALRDTDGNRVSTYGYGTATP